MDLHRKELASNGYTIVEDALHGRLCAEIAEAMPIDGAAGSRRLLEHSLIQTALAHLQTCSPVTRLLPPDAVAVQCTLFAKSDAANWLVPPHQDLSIPVAEHVDAAGCGGWAEKEGLLFVQPPVEVLAQLLAVRVELDGAPPPAGELHVVPGSHLLGRLPANEIAAVARRRAMHRCAVPRAGALVMRPLLIHGSGKAPAGVVRRVLHFLFGPPSLPCGLRWTRVA